MEQPAGSTRFYRFDIFTLDAKTGELAHAGKRQVVREQPLQLLLALLEQPGELVTREALVNRLWPAGTFVDFDRGLNKAVNHLREALGDSLRTSLALLKPSRAAQPARVRNGYHFFNGCGDR